MTKIGINGFNRTTKILLRILIEKDAKVVAINDPDVSIEEMVRMMKYDTNYGRYEDEIQVKSLSKIVGGEDYTVIYYTHSNPYE